MGHWWGEPGRHSGRGSLMTWSETLSQWKSCCSCLQRWWPLTYSYSKDDCTYLILVIFLISFLASLLTFGHQSTTARVITESIPPQVAEGENVLFIVHNLPKDVKSFGWFKGLKIEKQGIAMYRRRKNLVTNGPMHSGRETIYRNGSLLLEKVSRNDTGFYTLQTYNRHAKILSTTAVYLHVHGKWFIVNCVNGVRFISLNTYSRVFCAYPFYALWPHVGVWEFIAGHIWCRIMAIEQNLSFDFTLYIDICMVGNSDKDISLF